LLYSFLKHGAHCAHLTRSALRVCHCHILHCHSHWSRLHVLHGARPHGLQPHFESLSGNTGRYARVGLVRPRSLALVPCQPLSCLLAHPSPPPHEPAAPEKGDKPKARSWDGDLLVALVYISVAVGDLIHQCAVLMHGNPPTIADKDLPPLAAAATVVHLTFGLTIVPLLICCLRAAYQTVTRRDITLISAQYAVVWFLVLCLNVTAMGVFEYTLGRHHAFGGVKDDGVDSIFGKKGILFTIRLGFLPPEWIQKHFGQWKYVAVAPILLVAAFVLGRALWILARDPSTTATKQHRQRIRESCIMLMVQRLTIFIFAVFFWMVFLRPPWGWLVLAVGGMCLPGSVFAPGSGIHLAELDQIGTLTTVLFVQMLRASCFLHQKVMERRMSCVATAADEENLKAAAE
jgi:hypothetical protein